MSGALGTPRVHHRLTDSTNARARDLATGGAPHGTLVTASEQSAGRGRQGRRWTAPAGRALLMSLVLRDWPRLLPLAAALAVADVAGPDAEIKWPNDVHLQGRKVAGILVEGRPQEGWMVLGVGLNAALRPEDFPRELRDTAISLDRDPSEVEAMLAAMLDALELRLSLPHEEILDAFRARDALEGREITWSTGAGTAEGIDDDGRLLVRCGGEVVALDSGEVHLGSGS